MGKAGSLKQGITAQQDPCGVTEKVIATFSTSLIEGNTKTTSSIHQRLEWHDFQSKAQARKKRKNQMAAKNTSRQSVAKEKALPTHDELRELIEMQRYRCALSGAQLTPENAQIDHIHPVKQGGDHSIDNLQWVHERVNRIKGSMSNEAFIKWCTRVARHNSQA